MTQPSPRSPSTTAPMQALSSAHTELLTAVRHLDTLLTTPGPRVVRLQPERES